MNKTFIIFKNELITTLKRKGFIITTLALPVLSILGILIYQLLAVTMKPTAETDVSKVGYVDQVGIFNQYTQQGKIEFVLYPSSEQAKVDMVAGQITEYFVIPSTYIQDGVITRYTMKTEIEPASNVMAAGQNFLVGNLLQGKVSPEIATRIQTPVMLSNVILDQSGAVSDGQGGFGAMAISYLFGILLIMSIFTASGYLLQGLSEEKENRIMEILLSSVSTRQLITGKVLALGASGLIQMVFWLVTGWGLINLASSSIGGFFTGLQFPPNVMILGIVYYILGYFLFAILLAGIGAIAPTQRDGQQMSIAVTMLGAIPYFLMVFIIENGEHIISKILTIFPFTAPLTVMMRLNAGIPLWEIIVSVAVMILTIYGSLLLVSKVFRIYLLMYGKAPGWGEVFKTLRQA